jgi:RNA polymerase sigma-70 factor (TIGR02960 family)
MSSAAGADLREWTEHAERFRGELQLHCYRIVGSVQDAEDIVQETLLAAWRGYEGFEGRSSMRTWLYAIATNRSLNALRARRRRMTGPPTPPEDPPPHPPPAPTREVEPIWLEPYPDELLEGALDRTEEPDARYDAREAIGLAFTAGLQRLPPRQRAVLVLRDVLGFRAAEVAEMLEISVAAANGVLRRARASLSGELTGLRREDAPLPDSDAERAIVTRFVDAFEAGDVDGLVAILSDDAKLTMPPEPFQFEGRAAIGSFFSAVPAGGRLELFRLVATRANGQPAFACYLRDPHASIARAYGLMVLTLDGDRIAAITGFPDTGVFPHFGLPRTLRG